jgi:hypothetical protein
MDLILIVCGMIGTFITKGITRVPPGTASAVDEKAACMSCRNQNSRTVFYIVNVKMTSLSNEQEMTKSFFSVLPVVRQSLRSIYWSCWEYL